MFSPLEITDLLALIYLNEPTVTRPVQDSLAVLLLDNRLYIAGFIEHKNLDHNSARESEKPISLSFIS